MTEKFVLRSTTTSPFGRKVRMAIDALGLNNRITETPADPLDEKDTLRQQNPLGKMPCLVLQDGSTIYDSGIIIEFLQDVAGTERLLRLRGPERYRMLTQARLADGIMDASILDEIEGLRQLKAAALRSKYQEVFGQLSRSRMRFLFRRNRLAPPSPRGRRSECAGTAANLPDCR